MHKESDKRKKNCDQCKNEVSSTGLARNKTGIVEYVFKERNCSVVRIPYL